MSDNMTVNGSLYRSEKLAFIIVQSAASSRIHQWHFTGFKMAIACFRTVEEGVISDTVFSNNHVEGGIGMLSFGVGKCKLDCCNLTENSVYKSSLITMFSTHLYLNLTHITRNSVMHDSRQALMFAINSVCEYTNATFSRNHSPSAPLHQFEFRSCFGFWNCTFEENRHPEVMLCDGTCEFNFTNTTVSRNMGSFLTTSLNALISFNESWIYNNHSGDKPLFDIPGSKLFIYHPCVFFDNTGASVIDMRGGKSIVNMKHAKFKQNTVDDFVVGLDSGSNIEVKSCRFFDNSGEMGSIYVDNSTAHVANCKFGRNGRYSLHFLQGKANVRNSTFKGNFGGAGSSITAEQTHITLTDDYFWGDVVGGHLNVTGRKKYTGVRFSKRAK